MLPVPAASLFSLRTPGQFLQLFTATKFQRKQKANLGAQQHHLPGITKYTPSPSMSRRAVQLGECTVVSLPFADAMVEWFGGSVVGVLYDTAAISGMGCWEGQKKHCWAYGDGCYVHCLPLRSFAAAQAEWRCLCVAAAACQALLLCGQVYLPTVHPAMIVVFRFVSSFGTTRWHVNICAQRLNASAGRRRGASIWQWHDDITDEKEHGSLL